MTDDLNPNAKNSIDLAAARAKLDIRRRLTIMWQSLQELFFHAAIRGVSRLQVPAVGRQRKRRHRSSRRAETDGCFRRHGRAERLHQAAHRKNRTLCKAARGNLARPPLFYATSLIQAGVATGVLVESHTGRPTKIEGNSEHPGSLGAFRL